MDELKINILTFDGYHTRYCQNYRKYKNGRMAYEKTEEEYIIRTEGLEKYSSYESFRAAMSRKLNKS